MSEYNPAKMLLHGFGWSVPQSQGEKGPKNSSPHHHKRQVTSASASAMSREQEAWVWFPSPAPSWDGPDFVGRIGASEGPWKISASVIHSIRAHHGALRSFAVCQDESTFFTAGVGPGFKGSVLKWDLSRTASSSGYHAHEEVSYYLILNSYLIY